MNTVITLYICATGYMKPWWRLIVMTRRGAA